MAEAAEFGLRRGFTVPIVTGEGRPVGLSFAGSSEEASPSDLSVLVLLANLAVARCLEIRASSPARSAAALTTRERKALLWAAEGWSDGEIAARMGITVHGVDQHLRAVRRKLAART